MNNMAGVYSIKQRLKKSTTTNKHTYTLHIIYMFIAQIGKRAPN